MTQPTTRTTFKDYCKRKLGWPVVELNIDDDQVEDCIDDSLQFYQEYHFDATENTFLKHQISGSTLKLAGAPSGTFSNGEIITGGTSGVQATVHAYHSANTTLRYKDQKLNRVEMVIRFMQILLLCFQLAKLLQAIQVQQLRQLMHQPQQQ